MSSPLPLVLCAEDEESDGIILRRAFSREGIANPLVIVQDGSDVVDYLSGAPPYDDRRAHPLPGLLLLDLKMPRMNGFDVLEWLASRPDLKNIPVIVLSSSMAEADMDKVRRYGVKEYLVKPNGMTEYSKIVRQLNARWLAAAG